ncbi:MAG: hypothetical protein JWM16_2936 [Verrucomicrobiales bacterium]|nr:hypothetical protein [Verrucomicrobiales bacterium]
MLVFALTRWPGLLPPNFSAAYALAFCAGVYFPRRTAWWLPLATLMVSDVAINLYYHFTYGIDSFKWTQLINYAVFGLLIWLGTGFSPRSSWWKLVGGGVFGAIVFYLLTNTAAWFFNPFHNIEYTKTLAGWICALTKGTAGYPQTWEFLFRTFLSGGLFTGLFVGAMKLCEAAESAREKEAPKAQEDSPAPAKDGQEEPAT